MIRLLLLLSFLALFFPTIGVADEFGTRDEAVQMVARVEALVAHEGMPAAIEAINEQKPEFKIKDLYPFIYTLDGLNVAHGANVKMVGKSWINTKDQDGNYLIRSMVSVVNSPARSGWVNYKWPDPISHKILDKSAFVKRLDDTHFVGVGVYSRSHNAVTTSK